MDARLRTIFDLSIPYARDVVGRHEYDGVVQDLSPDGVRRGLANLGTTNITYDDAHDEAQARAFEESLRVRLGELELHRVNPLLHTANLELTAYDREYAPAAEREAARTRHLARWPDAVDAAIATLDRTPAPLAEAALPAVKGLATDAGTDENAVRALSRLIDHVDHAREHGDPDAAIGGPALARLVSATEARPVDLTELAARAESERRRLRTMLDEACHRVDPDRDTAQTMEHLLADHPDMDGVLAEAEKFTAAAIAWTEDQNLVPYNDGECRVGLVPDSQPWQVAMLVAAAPEENDGPSRFLINPPRADWDPTAQEQWLRLFSRMNLPNYAIHEVAPGHFSHGRALRRANSAVRRSLLSDGFTEGWALYCEQLALEEGFLGDDPRFAVGVAKDGLLRITRLACTIGLHTGAMTPEEAVRRFETDVFLAGPAAVTAMRRCLLDPASAFCYSWGA